MSFEPSENHLTRVVITLTPASVKAGQTWERALAARMSAVVRVRSSADLARTQRALAAVSEVLFG